MEPYPVDEVFEPKVRSGRLEVFEGYPDDDEPSWVECEVVLGKTVAEPRPESEDPVLPTLEPP